MTAVVCAFCQLILLFSEFKYLSGLGMPANMFYHLAGIACPVVIGLLFIKENDDKEIYGSYAIGGELILGGLTAIAILVKYIGETSDTSAFSTGVVVFLIISILFELATGVLFFLYGMDRVTCILPAIGLFLSFIIKSAVYGKVDTKLHTKVNVRIDELGNVIDSGFKGSFLSAWTFLHGLFLFIFVVCVMLYVDTRFFEELKDDPKGLFTKKTFFGTNTNEIRQSEKAYALANQVNNPAAAQASAAGVINAGVVNTGVANPGVASASGMNTTLETGASQNDVQRSQLICPECGCPLEAGCRVCPECGNPISEEDKANVSIPVVNTSDIKKICPECGCPLEGGESCCPECGFPLEENIVINPDMVLPKEQIQAKNIAEEPIVNTAKDIDNDSSSSETNNIENDNKAKKKKRWIMPLIMLSLLVIGGLTFVSIVYVVPYIKYNKANDYLKNGKYDKAYETFMEIKDFKDSGVMAEEAIYQKGMKIKSQSGSSNYVYVTLNNDESKPESFSEIYYGDKIYCHVSYFSSTPTKTELRAVFIWPDGSVSHYKMDSKYGNGDKSVFWFKEDNPDKDDVGKATIRIYDKNTQEFLGEASIELVDSKSL